MSAAERVCSVGAPGRGYCGRKTKDVTTNREEVTCDLCEAARRADEAVKR